MDGWTDGMNMASLGERRGARRYNERAQQRREKCVWDTNKTRPLGIRGNTWEILEKNYKVRTWE